MRPRCLRLATFMLEGAKFDYEKQKDKGSHKHFELKQRSQAGTQPSR